MLKRTKNKRAVSAATIAITTIGVLLGSVESTLAQQPKRMLAAPTSQPASSHLSVLEDAFWVCDYVATTRGGGDIPTCTAVYEALKTVSLPAILTRWCLGGVRTKPRNIKSSRLLIAQAISKSESTLKGEPS